MAESVQQTMERLRALGSPEQLEAIAAQSHFPSIHPKVNAHIHLPPNFSAFQSVKQAVILASNQGVRVLGASNYYDFSVYADLATEAHRHRIFPLFGLEIIALLKDLAGVGVLINDPGNPGKMYICGKGIVRFGPMTCVAQDLMSHIRANDEARMRRMVEQVEAIFAARGVGTGLTADEITDKIVRRHGVDRETVCLQERHIAQAFQEALFELFAPDRRIEKLTSIFGVRPRANPVNPATVQNEIRAHLMKMGKPAFIPESFVSFSEAYRLILELGGIPCYPTLADGTAPICTYEDPPEKLTAALLANRIHCVEFIPIRNRPEILQQYVRVIRAAGFVITGGTEHNTPDLLPLEPTCIGGTPVPEVIKEVFWEGACVVAAHQFLHLHGRCGYVNDAGELNPSFNDREQRIDHFRRLGEAVIARYYEQSSLS